MTLIEPGGFSTDWAGSSSKRSEPLPGYKEVHEEADRLRSQRVSAPGDPKASAAAVPRSSTPKLPLRIFFGERPLQLAKADYESRLATWEEWQPVSIEAQG